MAYNISDDIKSFVNTIWEEAQLVAREALQLPNLIRGFTDQIGTALRTRSDYGTVTYNQVNDYDDLTSQAFTPTAGQSLTPYEYGAQFLITDRRIRTDPFSVRQDAAAELGGGAGTHVQERICAQFSSLTGGTVGSTTGGTITWANIAEAASFLRVQKVPKPWSCVLAPGHWFFLGSAMTPVANGVGPTDLSNIVARQLYVSSAFGLDIYICGDIVSGTAAYGAAFGRDALAYDVRKAYSLEYERDASRRAWELNATMDYAVGIWRPKHGVQICATSVLP